MCKRPLLSCTWNASLVKLERKSLLLRTFFQRFCRDRLPFNKQMCPKMFGTRYTIKKTYGGDGMSGNQLQKQTCSSSLWQLRGRWKENKSAGAVIYIYSWKAAHCFSRTRFQVSYLQSYAIDRSLRVGRNLEPWRHEERRTTHTTLKYEADWSRLKQIEAITSKEFIGFTETDRFVRFSHAVEKMMIPLS